MKIADFRIQTSVPTTPDAGVLGVYANSSGILISVDANGAIRQLGTQYTGVYTNSQVSTGAALTTTGITYGGPGGTGLSTPSKWLPITYLGVNYAIPAYALA